MTSGAPVRPTLAFMARHPARWIALGFGSGLAPKAPGTVGTLWAWAAFAVIAPWMDDLRWALLIGGGTLVGWWACTRCAQHMNTADPGSIVWDEVLAFWLILWLIAPAGLLAQLIAFGLFRFFDAAKPGPVGWADRLFKGQRGGHVSWGQGWGILFDDFVAAGCTLAVIALYRFIMG
ncbi:MULTISPECIES: phosphatidylglycerophosphatase A [unclassified Roseateles]|uniref:phosphatidylglycerophosphatase A family protein n=1 Tax=unclassified Roseateles TaxID=2626991 RepID=UPI0006F3E6A4|nr:MULTISPECIES: phosphatidylglycerophosphatase A [unclassified Roseateles]KQW45745.1 phosphatidylglycerophosphatase [Pelomonas sp. Root405]KRA72589.1 phosphatidylglycerophosphatase [Pelomonas sp. Root662]